MKIYIAGPDIFRPDVLDWAESVRLTCAGFGHEALIPFDLNVTTPEAIFQANMLLLQSAEIVIANLNPFRGAEPDSGTCVEVGYALAIGKKAIGYIQSPTTMIERVAALQGTPLTLDHDNYRDQDGLSIENFGLPLNLMLSVPVKMVIGGLVDCLTELNRILIETNHTSTDPQHE